MTVDYMTAHHTTALAEPALTPIDTYLRAQAVLTPVERFADAHANDLVPAGAKWWQDRLPSALPGVGQQFGFEVDLDACTGCGACVTACHSLNGLDEGEAWRQVGTLHGAGERGPVVQTITTSCHHCVDPACLSGCPVDAYSKDETTGIVSHLDDQCIGCSYCTLMCPYEVPSFHHDLGIVRKCDLCADRLAVGEAPACVQGCPNGAIRVAVVDVEELEARARGPAHEGNGALVPGAPPSRITVPTTTYHSADPLPDDLLAADHRSAHPSAAHTPLAVMLVLTQLAVGLFVLDIVLTLSGLLDRRSSLTPGLAVGAGVVALTASLFHLGRPWLAWRAVIGIRHSWLSREIVLFTGFAALATADAVSRATNDSSSRVLGIATAVVGVSAIASSVAIYAATGRLWWRVRTTAARFVTTAVVTGGLGLATAVAAAGSASDGALTTICLIVMGTAVAGLTSQAVILRRATRGTDTELDRTACVLLAPLRRLTISRFALTATGAIALPLLVIATQSAIVATIALTVTLAGEAIERRLFFSASAPPRMPGLLR
jgi:Fe-S-cluster-containing dehydrogenase component/DMSO reductase anchor subunit